MKTPEEIAEALAMRIKGNNSHQSTIQKWIASALTAERSVLAEKEARIKELETGIYDHQVNRKVIGDLKDEKIAAQAQEIKEKEAEIDKLKRFVNQLCFRSKSPLDALSYNELQDKVSAQAQVIGRLREALKKAEKELADYKSNNNAAKWNELLNKRMNQIEKLEREIELLKEKK